MCRMQAVPHACASCRMHPAGACNSHTARCTRHLKLPRMVDQTGRTFATNHMETLA